MQLSASDIQNIPPELRFKIPSRHYDRAASCFSGVRFPQGGLQMDERHVRVSVVGVRFPALLRNDGSDEALYDPLRARTGPDGSLHDLLPSGWQFYQRQRDDD